MGGRKMNAKWIRVKNEPIPEFEIQAPDKVDRIKLMIHRCLDLDMEIPKEWIEEYSGLVKEE